MTLEILAEPVLLQTTPDDIVRVGKTRVTLETVVAVFKQGLTAEEIVYRYPSLKLADVYTTIAFYLNHELEVETYDSLLLTSDPKLKFSASIPHFGSLSARIFY